MQKDNTADQADERETVVVPFKRVLEAILVASPEPLTVEELAGMVRGAARMARDEERKRIEDELGKKMGGGDDDEAGGGGKKKGKKRKKGKKGKAEEEKPAEPVEVDVSGVRDALRKAQAARPEMAYAKVAVEDVAAALVELGAEYDEDGRAFTVLERADGWKIFTRADYAGWVKQLFPEKKPERLSGPALETLSIIAYRQPIIKAAIEAVRGVSCDGVIQKLLDRNIIRISGRAELPGRPLLYETTELFFEHFGIRSVDDLPNAAELRTVELPEPELEEEKAAEDSAGGDEGKEGGEGGEGEEGGEDGAAEAEVTEDGEVASAGAEQEPQAEDAAGEEPSESEGEAVVEDVEEGSEEDAAASEEEVVENESGGDGEEKPE
ncbi:MAG: SMC-Scp complex subunit ScpB [Verrucomicrobiales bacterium]|nr:SMC-Scp complex subunit ScpB [Verrucomicrobiales bacterium]